MSIGKRSVVMVLLVTFTGLVYAGARAYSPSLIAYVVEQSLLQKLPPEMDSGAVNERFTVFVASCHDHEVRLQQLLVISKYLEKVQKLTVDEVERLLPARGCEMPPDR